MRTFLTTLFFLACLFAAIAVTATMTDSAKSSDVTIAVVAVAFAGLIYLGRHAYLIRFGRLGLLKPRLFWKPLKPEERQGALKTSAAEAVSTLLRNMGRPMDLERAKSDDIGYQVFDEMRKIAALGYDRKTRSDDELRSERQLLRFVETFKADRSAPPLKELRGVRDKAVFLDLRKKVDDWYARRAASAEAYTAWKQHVGDVNRGYLLEDGWVRFLESLDGPDIHLWHGVATDFHDIEGDRLSGAFWILEQPECDKATASDFILLFVAYMLERPDVVGDTLARFADVVLRYNTGFYKFHSIRAGETRQATFAEGSVDAEMKRMAERAVGWAEKRSQDTKALVAQHAGLPRPVGLLDPSIDPIDGDERNVSSGYAFWDDAGLHLSYPGMNWRQSA